jgi:hypothetical protein
VGDVRQSLRLPPEPEIYNALASTSYAAATLVVSVAIPPERLIAPVRSAIREVNPNQTVFDVKTMEQVISAAHADVDLSLWFNATRHPLGARVASFRVHAIRRARR